MCSYNNYYLNIVQSLHVILVLLLHHLGVNYTTINILASSVCVESGVQRVNSYILINVNGVKHWFDS